MVVVDFHQYSDKAFTSSIGRSVWASHRVLGLRVMLPAAAAVIVIIVLLLSRSSERLGRRRRV